MFLFAVSAAATIQSFDWNCCELYSTVEHACWILSSAIRWQWRVEEGEPKYLQNKYTVQIFRPTRPHLCTIEFPRGWQMPIVFSHTYQSLSAFACVCVGVCVVVVALSHVHRILFRFITRDKSRWTLKVQTSSNDIHDANFLHPSFKHAVVVTLLFVRGLGFTDIS